MCQWSRSRLLRASQHGVFSSRCRDLEWPVRVDRLTKEEQGPASVLHEVFQPQVMRLTVHSNWTTASRTRYLQVHCMCLKWGSSRSVPWNWGTESLAYAVALSSNAMCKQVITHRLRGFCQAWIWPLPPGSGSMDVEKA